MINTITLNPAIDHIIYLNRFERNITNRIRSTAITMGGKGTHVSLNLKLMGSDSRAFGFGFGAAGRQIMSMLREGGVEPYFIYGEGMESRTNYLIVEEETKDASLAADKGPLPSDAQVQAFYELMTATVQDGDYLVLSGDTSNFPDSGIYNKLIDLLSGRSVRVFLDASGNALRNTIGKGIFLVKPNVDELSSLTDRRIASEADVVSAISGLDEQKISVVAVSLGGDGSIVRAEDGLYRVESPKVNVYNTVGCGDCFLSGLLHGFEQGMPFEEILRYAAATSAAMAESPLSVFFDTVRAEELKNQVKIRRI